MAVNKKTATKKSWSAKKSVAVGVGLAAAGLATYLLIGTRGSKRRVAIKKWVVAMEKDIAREVKKLKRVTQKDYNKIVASVARKYKHLEADEIRHLVKEAKSHFQGAKRAMKSVVKSKKS